MFNFDENGKDKVEHTTSSHDEAYQFYHKRMDGEDENI
jgi:hypothetical protein